MYRFDWKKLYSVLTYAVLLLILYFLQDAVCPHILLFGARPLLLPMAVVGVSLRGDLVRGGVFGLCAGVLCDTALNQTVALCLILFTLLGIFCAYLADTTFTGSFPSFFVLCAAALLIIGLCQLLPLLFSSAASPLPLFGMACRQALSSLIFSLPVYYLCRLAGRRPRQQF